MIRPHADPVDGATPSGASSVAEALLTAAHMVDGDRAGRYGETAANDAAGALCTSGPGAAIGRSLAGGRREAAVGSTSGGGRHRRCAIGSAGRRATTGAPGSAVVVGGPVDSMPLLAGRDRVRGADAAYICPRTGVRPAGHRRSRSPKRSRCP